MSHESRKSTPRITGRYDHHDPTKQHAENHEQASNSRIHINDAMRSLSAKARRVGFSRGWFNCAQKASRLRAQCALPFAFWHRACFLQARLFLSLKQGRWGGNSAPSASGRWVGGREGVANLKLGQQILISKSCRFDFKFGAFWGARGV